MHFISASALTVGAVLDVGGLYISVWIQGNTEIGGHILDACSVDQKTVGVVLDVDGLYISVWIQGDPEIGSHILDACSMDQSEEET